MAPSNHQADSQKSRLAVIHRPKYDKDISQEPEMKELKKMLREGELDPDRAKEYLEQIEEEEKGDT